MEYRSENYMLGLEFLCLEFREIEKIMVGLLETKLTEIFRIEYIESGSGNVWFGRA